MQCSAVQCRAVQCRYVQNSLVHLNTVQWNRTLKFGEVKWSTVQWSRVHLSLIALLKAVAAVYLSEVPQTQASATSCLASSSSSSSRGLKKWLSTCKRRGGTNAGIHFNLQIFGTAGGGVGLMLVHILNGRYLEQLLRYNAFSVKKTQINSCTEDTHVLGTQDVFCPY